MNGFWGMDELDGNRLPRLGQGSANVEASYGLTRGDENRSSFACQLGRRADLVDGGGRGRSVRGGNGKVVSSRRSFRVCMFARITWSETEMECCTGN